MANSRVFLWGDALPKNMCVSQISRISSKQLQFPIFFGVRKSPPNKSIKMSLHFTSWMTKNNSWKKNGEEENPTKTNSYIFRNVYFCQLSTNQEVDKEATSCKVWTPIPAHLLLKTADNPLGKTEFDPLIRSFGKSKQGEISD